MNKLFTMFLKNIEMFFYFLYEFSSGLTGKITRIYAGFS